MISPQSDRAARARFEAELWPDGAVCPHCGLQGRSKKLEQRDGTAAHGRAGLHQCRSCRKQFTVTVGTVFEGSRIPLDKWLRAIQLMCETPEGVNARQLQRQLGLGSYRSASFICRRIRWAMTRSPMAEALREARRGKAGVAQ
jgi:transposase-like protein